MVRRGVCRLGSKGRNIQHPLKYHLRRTVMSSINAVTNDDHRFTPLPEIPLTQVRAAAEHDDEYQKLKQTIVTGFPGTKGELG